MSALGEHERCPGCGSVVSDRFQSCRPVSVDVTQTGYRYLAGTWGYCLHLGRHVKTSEPGWLEEFSNDLIMQRDAALAEASSAEADYDSRGERLWRLAVLAGLVPIESDNDATAEQAIAEALRAATEHVACDRAANERQRLSLDATLNGLIAAELDAGNDERAAALRCLRAWNRGAGYVIQRRAT